MEEKLINLLSTAGWDLFTDGIHSKRAIAKHLIANGVTVPVRCKNCEHGVWDEEEQMWECILPVDLTGDLDTYRMFREYNDGEHFCSYGEER